MRVLIRNRNFWLMLATDVVMIGLAYYFAYLLRFEGEIPEPFFTNFTKTVFLVIPIKIAFFFLFDLYRGMWRYTSVLDFINILKAAAVASISLIVLFYFLFSTQGFSRSVFILDFILTLGFIAGVRLGIRIFLSRKQPAAFPLIKRGKGISKSCC
jgi:FlaA1/EpsC-like NDP-sugar epimerase